MFVGIYAHRYGFIPAGDGVSITESEYDAATRANLPRFIYVLDENHPWRPVHIDDGDSGKQLKRFKSSLLQRHMCKPFTTEDHLVAGVVADIGYYLAMRNSTRVGPGIDVPYVGLESFGAVAETPDDHWNAARNGVYAQAVA